jgi:hypothetical protein
MTKSAEKKTEAPRAVDLVDEVRESAKAGLRAKVTKQDADGPSGAFA